MLTKLTVLFVSGILGISYDYLNKREKNTKLVYFLLILFLSGMFAFREYIFENPGTDYFEYKHWFDIITIHRFRNSTFNSIGFNAMILLFKTLHLNFFVFLFAVGLIINNLIFGFTKRNCENFALSTLVYIAFVYGSTFNIMRQWIAVALFVYSWNYILNKKYIHYYICIAIAATFHTSAVLLVLIPLLFLVDTRYMTAMAVIVLAGIVLFFNPNVLNSILFSGRFSLLSSYEMYTSRSTGYSNYVYPTICGTLLFLIGIFREKFEDENFKKLYLLLSIAFAFSLASMRSFMFSRFLSYFLPILLIMIPMLTRLFMKKDRVIVGGMMLLVFIYIYL